ncbi:MAG TPA: hypothetical protein VJP60_00365 [Rhizomicrobium sp.]|nr:hypothetical protein [Rhizomicrobium sp.]
MEAARLTGPPDWLERIVLLAIPPAAREAVAGDLWETYCGPRQYAAEALRTIPFVIASQVRRNLNLPAILLQAALIFIFLGGPVTLILLPVLLLRSAYQQTARPPPQQVFRETVLLSSGVMVLLLLIMSAKSLVRADHATWFGLFLDALFLAPFLCLFRAGLILQGDRSKPLAAGELPRDELALSYSGFLKGNIRHNLLQAMALALAAACGFFFAWNTLVIGLFVLASLYLLQDSARRPCSQLDFVSLRARYQHELARQQHLRRFLRWLWFTPVLVALHARLAINGLETGRPIAGFLDCVGAAILCFLVAALNREHGGRVQEQIVLLDRAREKIVT